MSLDQVAENLLQQIHRDMGDYFEFFAARTGQGVDFGTAIRFHVTARLAGRVFERFHVDIGIDDPIVEPVEYLSPPKHLAFAGVTSSPIPCYSVVQHIAEKLHSLVRPQPIETSRIKDFVDILIFAFLVIDIHAEHLYAAIQIIFETRKDIVPKKFDQIPMSWRLKFNQFTKNIELPFTDFEEAVNAAQLFINPVLDRAGKEFWDPGSWSWK